MSKVKTSFTFNHGLVLIGFQRTGGRSIPRCNKLFPVEACHKNVPVCFIGENCDMMDVRNIWCLHLLVHICSAHLKILGFPMGGTN